MARKREITAGIDGSDWYSGRFEAYSSLTRLLHATVENIIRASGVVCLSVTSRTKSIPSFVEKMSRKGYDSPEKATDLAGIRVITFIETDAVAAAKLMRDSFTIHPGKSLDKSEELGDSQVGYRSIHLICELGSDRTALPEYKPFRGMLFEVQVRTVLQHAWAEIDHDRGYKFSGVLPGELRRRLNLLAGQLELADKEFSRLAHDVDQYSSDLQKKQERGDLNIEISSASLGEYLRILMERRSLPQLRSIGAADLAPIIDELAGFGIKTLQHLDGLITAEFVNDLKKSDPSETDAGFLRRAMMYADIDKYFARAWRRHWSGLSVGTEEMMRKKWGDDKIDSIKKTLKLTIPKADAPS
jgi:putative GTP pyrophosphokinase